MLLVSFTVWGIVCLRHSWKAMWTRLADWLVMSNSLPQREDEPLCGLHGWDASMWVQSCAHTCAGSDWKQVFFSLRSGRDFQDVPPRILITSRRSSREAEYQWGQSDIHGAVADVTVSELRETRAVGSECGQGPSFRDSTGPSFSVHFSLLHLVSSMYNGSSSSGLRHRELISKHLNIPYI